MIYQNLKFTVLSDRPYFITNFISTVDGKVKVLKPGYWPIGSLLDFETFTYLRAHADVIVDGKNTALEFGKATIETIHSESFRNLRKELGKEGNPKYFILTENSNEQLERVLENSFGYKSTIFSGSISDLAQKLHKDNMNVVFVDGGPKLLGSFFKEDLIDEVFLTISPKIFGNAQNQTLTMMEGTLLPPEKIKNLELLSMQAFDSEIYLRYKLKNV
ncbi:MAG: hypothetical protein A3G13_02910 [Candidatus Levybacteria bacterium RIFCSPLOWO2_12_FULL_37_7]|nr:MAG: hypothetical protein A3J14_01800 [Candidatus Levybacteria bacterium RIFCSPLOWO2_02_FULL_37_18]OGH50409.1 MAG: hypothetical protein A3G13_02910 [Candidatus Levybacteria bacterium RIFCSPLOWO2_12_FULL_37_7]